PVVGQRPQERVLADAARYPDREAPARRVRLEEVGTACVRQLTAADRRGPDIARPTRRSGDAGVVQRHGRGAAGWRAVPDAAAAGTRPEPAAAAAGPDPAGDKAPGPAAAAGEPAGTAREADGAIEAAAPPAAAEAAGSAGGLRTAGAAAVGAPGGRAA